MFWKLIHWFIGTKNYRTLKHYKKYVDQINALEPKFEQIPDSELPSHTLRLKSLRANGHSLEQLLPEAFALVREASKRTIGQRHFDVQLIGGMALNDHSIAEMKTGEGKTLSATLALYLNALDQKGCHLVTVNDYLAKRDAQWMAPIFNILGMSVGFLQNDMETQERQEAYKCDITYGTNNEFGFDYLRDNMKFDPEEMCQRGHYFAIVDEVDSILIDEARTPLIISGPSEKVGQIYIDADRAIAMLDKDCYEVDEKMHTAILTEKGIDRVEEILKIDNLYSAQNVLILHHVNQALKARTLYKRDVHYLVSQDNQVLIIDEYTGRVLSGRRYGDGLHQAIEAKEGVKIERENQTMATISLQNYFKLYKKLAGMTGTASTDAHEFHKIYKLKVVSVPPNRPMKRIDENDLVFMSVEEKYNAVIQDILNCHKRGQPVLVGTGSVEASEVVSSMLSRLMIPHEVLNAKNHAREAEIIKFAGEAGRVTISTSMAGRGTDIKLAPGVAELGGLRVIGTERQENRRIDDQLRGRAGRQGDPGSSRFYISLEDDLMRIFGGENVKYLMQKFVTVEKGESFDDSYINNHVASCQEKLERKNFESRRHLLEYDDVMNSQRTVIYEFRQKAIASGESLDDFTKDIIFDFICQTVDNCWDSTSNGLDAAKKALSIIEADFDVKIKDQASFLIKDREAFINYVSEFVGLKFVEIRSSWNPEFFKRALKWVLLETIDYAWKIHLQNLDHLQEGINLRSYSSKNPLYEYKRESYEQFLQTISSIKQDICRKLFRLKFDQAIESEIEKIESEREKDLESLTTNVQEEPSEADTKTAKRSGAKIGRNDMCPCGSGKKYKQCCLK